MGELPHHHEDQQRLERLRSFIQEPESFQEVANLCRLLSDNSRVRIFWLLCHCEECVMNLSALVGMSSPAASHHLRQLKDSGLIVSRRVGKEVYYRAADTEVAQLLHQIIERTVEVTCPQSDSQLVSGAPHLPPLDQHDYCGSCPAEQLEVIRQVHRFLTEHLDSRITIEQLSRQFLMNPSTMKELFKEVYGSSIASDQTDLVPLGNVEVGGMQQRARTDLNLKSLRLNRHAVIPLVFRVPSNANRTS